MDSGLIRDLGLFALGGLALLGVGWTSLSVGSLDDQVAELQQQIAAIEARQFAASQIALTPQEPRPRPPIRPSAKGSPARAKGSKPAARAKGSKPAPRTKAPDPDRADRKAEQVMEARAVSARKAVNQLVARQVIREEDAPAVLDLLRDEATAVVQLKLEVHEGALSQDDAKADWQTVRDEFDLELQDMIGAEAAAELRRVMSGGRG